MLNALIVFSILRTSPPPVRLGYPEAHQFATADVGKAMLPPGPAAILMPISAQRPPKCVSNGPPLVPRVASQSSVMKGSP